MALWQGSHGGRPNGIVIDGYDLTFPVLQIALFTAVATAALPDLARGVQRLVEIFIALVALACAVGAQGLPVNVLGSLAIGWGVTAAVRLIFGSPLGLPSAEDVRLLLAELGISASAVRPAARQIWGVARYEATETGPANRLGHLAVEVYGRDAADARLLTKAGRFALYRDSGPTLTITRLQQVEHEAHLILRAGRAGVAVPEVAGAATAGPPTDALLVCRWMAGAALADTGAAAISDAVLDDVYRQLLALRRERIAHGAISGDALLVNPATDRVTVTDFRNSSAGAATDQLDRDLAGALAATARRQQGASQGPRHLGQPQTGRQLSPGKLALLLGGSFGQGLIVAMALSVSLLAFRDHVRLPVLIVVITLAAMIGGASPSPGGMGVVEAA